MDQHAGRKKSCAECRKSKARCSLGSPCRRCEERSLSCKYHHPLPARTARRLRPATDVRERGLQHRVRLADQWDSRTEADVDLPRVETDMVELFASQEQEQQQVIAASTAIFQDINPQGTFFPINSDPQATPSFLSSMQSSDMSDLFGLSFSPGVPQSPKEVQHNRPQATGLRPSDPTTRDTGPPMHQEYPVATSLRPLHDKAPLAPRTRSTVANCFTARVLHGQLLSYPRLLGQGGKLPSFIYPDCAMDGPGLSAECCAQGYHQCLPESLAICSGLMRSFETKTLGNTAFLWKSVYSEVERLTREVFKSSLISLVIHELYDQVLIYVSMSQVRNVRYHAASSGASVGYHLFAATSKRSRVDP